MVGLYFHLNILPAGERIGADMLFYAFFAVLLAISALMIVSLCVVGAVLIKSVIGPLNRLHRMAKRIKDGDLSHQESYARSDEFGFVFNEFDEMRGRLARTLNDLSEQDSRRREMLQSIAHDIKTPLTAISGAAEMISLADSGCAYSRLIMERCGVLNRMVEDLADFAALESNTAKLDLSKTGLADYLTHTLEAVAAVPFTVESDGGYFADIDRKLFARVIQNIATNSVKFGATEFSASISSGAGRVIIRFSDNGAGVSEEECEKLFERFYRGDKARSGKGSGLGLSIAKQIVALHGGDIWALKASPNGLSVFIALDSK